LPEQIRHFRQPKGAFEGFRISARRAGFEMKYEIAFDKVASFDGADDRDARLLHFSVPFGDPVVVSAGAE
jgi:hypothetical protein